MLRRFGLYVLTLAVLGWATILAAQTPTHGPVVVELFTSEGCSSCPPVDRMLAQLQEQHTWNGAELIVLGEHVDYWNHLGWRDRFSSHAFTERQQEYAQASHSEVYTPEVVLDGQPNLSGKDSASFQRALAESASQAKPAQVSIAWSNPQQLHVAVENGGNRNAVLLFVTEDNLTTTVKAGENGGTTLHHAAVVREMRKIGKTKGGQFQSDIAVKIDPEWQRNPLRVIVLVQQDNGAGKIVGAAALKPATLNSQDRPTSAETRASQ